MAQLESENAGLAAGVADVRQARDDEQAARVKAERAAKRNDAELAATQQRQKRARRSRRSAR